ncbi:sugar transferase [Roseivirga thermotolerans]|uniref:sugar transferase n=1 Tax=Roseivirga thermotolerans TaxID=1758176 RepID=UPI00273D36E2|nr:sugar transferase [Roseivirga thermotolerans]
MYRLSKRLFDFIISLIVFILLLPLLLPIMIGLKLTGEGYIFYKQKRIGYQRKYFHILKFATMLKDSPNMGTGSITLRNDPRITPMGGFLRKTKINELPQIINIIKGDLSLVGPRPLVDRTFNAYTEEVQNKVYNLKPGLTGIGSIVFRDEEALVSNYNGDPHEFYKNKIAPYKGALEMWYQQNASFLLDMKLIFLTAWVVIFPDSNLHFRLFKTLPKKPEF